MHLIHLPSLRRARTHTFAVAVALAAGTAQAADFFSESFSGPGLNAELQQTTAGAFTFNGVASNATGTRNFIRTVDTDYLSINFIASITYTVPETAGGNPIAFVGFGEGTPDTLRFREPLRSLYLRAAPDAFDAGALRPIINSAPGSAVEQTPISNAAGGAGSGTHRVQISKFGNNLTFAFDLNSSSGAFVSDVSKLFVISTDAPFLNTGNSRIFLGSQIAGTTFDSFTVVPEPATSWVVAPTGLALVLLWRRQVRRNARRTPPSVDTSR
jgi:hypothetical protein